MRASKARESHEDVDGAFDLDTMMVQIVPSLGVARHTGIETEIFVRMGIDTLTILGSGARMIAGTDSSITLFH